MELKTFNKTECERCYNFLDHQNVTEIRFIDPKKKKQPFSKFVNTKKEFVEVCESYNGQYNIYAGIHEREGEGTKGEHVVAIKTIILDIDAIREKGFEKQPATEEELKQAEIITDKIINDIKSKKGIKLHSGNGFQLWFAIPKIVVDNINRKSMENKLQLFQDLIIEKYDINGAIDKIGDLPRIIKIWGTYNIKGDNTKERPYRVATVVSDGFERDEDETLRQVILDLKQKKEKEYEFESTDEIDFDKLPPCIEYLLKYYENKDGSYWFRIIQFLASFFSSIKLDKEKAKQIIFDWNKKQEHHEEGEGEEILFTIDRVYKNKINIANCEKIKKENSGFPFFGLADLKLCNPENNCRKCINPVICWKRKNEDDGVKQNFNNAMSKVIDKTSLIEQFYIKQPFFYDKSQIWWLWNKNKYCWERKDDIDMTIMISNTTSVNTINSTERSEILQTMMQIGRQKIPKNAKKSWVQFKEIIYDVKNDRMFKATPEFFVTNPLPFEIGESEDTPTIDKLFKEWVDEEHVEILYEILAYCMLPDYPLHRIFCFNGEGMNGKSTYLKLLRKFVGKNNISTAELDSLIHSRFDKVRLYKKLVCTMGETDFEEMRRTSMLKQLTGSDLIPFEFKNKDPFEDVNYAKILIATNNIPPTTDKTLGFYRRWVIIDFPNIFEEEKDVLGSIPKEEYHNLSTKCLSKLKRVLKLRSFTNEGSVYDRMKKYEDKSNPFDKFWSESIDDSNPDSFIFKFDFKKKLDEWCKDNRFRQISERIITKFMKEKKVEDSRQYTSWIAKDGERKQYRCWMGIKWKEE